MKTLLVLLVLISADIAWNANLKLEEFSVEYFKYQGRRDAYYPEYPDQGRWEGGSNVNYTLGLYDLFYWQNQLHFAYEKQGGQIRDAGWRFELGARLSKYFDLYKFHHSTHSLERVHPDNIKFNVVDTYGIRINLVH